MIIKDLTTTPYYDEAHDDFQYKFGEGQYLKELRDYVRNTYGEHYSGKGGTQTFELIQDSDNGVGFAMGSIMKYASRYGKKNGFNRKDLMKILHYGLQALHTHDKAEAQKKDKDAVITYDEGTVVWAQDIQFYPNTLLQTTEKKD